MSRIFLVLLDWGVTTAKYIVVIAIAISVYRFSSSNFETVVFSLLLLIYAQISEASLSARFLEQERQNVERHWYVLNLLKDPNLNDPDVKKGISQKKRDYEQANIYYFICIIGDTIITLIALWHIAFLFS